MFANVAKYSLIRSDGPLFNLSFQSEKTGAIAIVPTATATDPTVTVTVIVTGLIVNVTVTVRTVIGTAIGTVIVTAAAAASALPIAVLATSRQTERNAASAKGEGVVETVSHHPPGLLPARRLHHPRLRGMPALPRHYHPRPKARARTSLWARRATAATTSAREGRGGQAGPQVVDVEEG